MGHGWRVYNERARARVAYTMPCVIGMGAWAHGRMNIIPWARARWFGAKFSRVF